MTTLYITQQDTVLRKVDERLKVTQKGTTLIDIPMIKVSQVVIMGRVTVTAATLQALLERQIPVCYLTQHGRYIGRVEPSLSKNVLLRSAQYRAAFDTVRSLALARQMVRGKLANMRVMLQRANRDLQNSAVTQAVAQLKAHVTAAEVATSHEQLRGIEGAGSAAYFGVFDALLKPSGMHFVKRVRRPPTDPVNALLSFGYALLANDMQSTVNAVGFDPYQGYLHVEHYGRPALALDLMEEFRPLIVDSVVLTCVNKRIIGPKDFVIELGQVHRLTDAARRKFLIQYEERKQTEVHHPVFGYKVTYARCLELQARLLGKYLKGEIEEYIPFVTR
ncbi:MAG: CRISPR-associated endonuclease Cas1 [Candidatus Tectimicrobiota bacterium]|nr:MAG: CRISPR-associated endonuclease Cas1 [Candidatus Tectomicrobia bacterium]